LVAPLYATANAEHEREVAATLHTMDADLLAEVKAVHGPDSRRARAQLVRSLAVSFNFSCVQAVGRCRLNPVDP
jgi:hypothetical protein